MDEKLSQKTAYDEAKLQDYHKTVLGACDTHNQLKNSHSPISDNSFANITLSLTSEQKEKNKC